MAITFPATTLADGALISKTWVDMIVDDINHLVDRPDGYAEAVGEGQTATTTTFTQLTNPSVTVTPKRTGKLLVIAEIGLASSATTALSGIRIDYNGSKTNATNMIFSVANLAMSETMITSIAVTANVAYTIKLEFNLSSGAGTITAVTNKFNRIFAIEIGA